MLNFGNHFTESTFKQFFNERVKFKPDFETAFKMIENSDTNKMIFYLYKLFDDSCIWVFLTCAPSSHSEWRIQLENTPQNKWVGVSVVGQTSWMRPGQAELSLSVVISVFLSCRLDEVHP